MSLVKKSAARPYDATGRMAQAERTREGIVEVARRTFVEHGYAATTIASIAREAGVSVETVYKAFGGKPGLVRAIWQRALAGRGETPAHERSDAMSASEPDPRALVRKWGQLAAEVSPLVSSILLLVRAAADADPELAAIVRESEQQRLERMRRNAGVLAKRGFLKKSLTAARAAEIMWAYTSPELYELLVVRRGWKPEELGDFVGAALEAALLRPSARATAGR